MFHNNFKVYQIGFDQYSVEVEYWNEYLKKVNYINFNLSKEDMGMIVEMLTNLDFDDRTPSDGE